MKSIVQKDKKCFICGTEIGLERHHIFGAANRQKSERYGLTVWMCHYHHNEPPEGAHYNKDTADLLHEVGQYAFEQTHTRKQFLQEFGRNYLGWDEE